MRSRFVVGAGLMALVAASGCGGSAAQESLNLQGIWQEGGAGTNGDLVTVQGDTLTVEHPGGRKEQMTFTLNGSRSPKQIDLTMESGEVLQGIYELDGDTWRLCFRGGGGRPATFSPEAGVLKVLSLRK